MRSEPAASFTLDALTTTYEERMYGNNLSGMVLRRSHTIPENQLRNRTDLSKILEIGGGGGYHVKFVKHEFCEYVLSDSSPKMLETAKRKITDPRVKMVLQQGEVLPYPDGTFDRIIASHVLEHIYKPHLAIREWCRVLRKGGVLTLILPCDPGLAWRLGKSLGPRRRVEKMGLPYDYLSALEHVNPIGNLVAIIHYHFNDFREYWWPFVVPSIDINLIYCVNIFI